MLVPVVFKPCQGANWWLGKMVPEAFIHLGRSGGQDWALRTRRLRPS
jgi:hypothetical protein